LKKKDIFENDLNKFSREDLSGLASNKASSINDAIVIKEINKACKRLAKNPSLFSGDPDRIFTYDDPILALAAYFENNAEAFGGDIAAAGVSGEDLQRASWWPWAKTAIHAWLSRGDQSFVILGGRTPTETIKFDKDRLRLAVVGDGGYKGVAQENVLRMITTRHQEVPFDLLIHLGDTYFAASAAEMLRNFLSPFMATGLRVLTLLGNHDLYFGAEPFNDALNILAQPGRYFCIENNYWRIACLDSALASERILRHQGLLDEGQLKWLYRLISDSGQRNVVIMSHHPIVSGWSAGSLSLKAQLRHALKAGRVVSCYWGHEHMCATYEKSSCGFYGACVGNGAFNEIWTRPSQRPRPSWYAKGRCECYGKRSPFWPHGYLELDLRQDAILETYHLENGRERTRRLRRQSRTFAEAHADQ